MVNRAKAFQSLMSLSRRAAYAGEHGRGAIASEFNRTLHRGFGVGANYNGTSETWTGFNSLNYSGYNGISEKNVKTISTYFACLRVISNGVASLPLKFYREINDKGRIRREPYTDSLTRILSIAPNPRITPWNFWDTMTGWAIEGGAFAKIDYSRGGEVLGLYPIHPSRIQIMRNKNGSFRFKVYNDDGTTYEIPETEMFYYFGQSIDGYIGYSMAQLMQNTLVRSNETDRYARHFFSNNGRPHGALVTDEKLSPQARNNLKQSWQEQYGGPMNAGKTAVLENGIKYMPFGAAFKDLEFVEQWRWNQRQICEFMGVNPRKVGVESNSKGWATIDAEEVDHYNSCLKPWLIRPEQEIRRQLMSSWKYPDDIKCEFDFNQVLRCDIKTRSEMAEKKILTGQWSPNDGRTASGENPIDMPEMDMHYMQSAMLPIDKLGLQPTQGTTTQKGPNPDGK